MLTDNDNCLFLRFFSLNQPAINEVRQIVRHVLLKIAVSSDELDNVTLATYEYLTNLLRHAKGEDSQISIQLIQDNKGSYRLEISDKLVSFNPLEQRPILDFATEDLKFGGMGISLLQHHFPNASYTTSENINTFQIPLQGPSKRKRVLCIDDDKSQLALLQAYLSKQYDVYCAENLKQGMEIVYDVVPDILILDFELKECTAIDVLEKLNQTHLKCNMSIIILTGTTLKNVEQQTSRLGIDRFLTKPVGKEALDLAIEQLLYRSIVKGNATKLTEKENKQIYNQHVNSNVSFFGSIVTQHSGDFVFTISNEKHIVIVLADVVGHGENASLQSAELKGFVSGFLTHENSIEMLLPTLNQRFCNNEFDSKHYLTALVVVITNESFGIACAGHPLPILIEDDRVIELGQTDTMFGLDCTQEYGFRFYPRKDHQKLLLYTDGWFDNRYSALPATLCVKNYIQSMGKLAKTDFCQTLWQLSLPKASKEFDDASLVVIT